MYNKLAYAGLEINKAKKSWPFSDQGALRNVVQYFSSPIGLHVLPNKIQPNIYTVTGNTKYSV